MGRRPRVLSPVQIKGGPKGSPLICTGDRTRTYTSEILDPKSSASTNSATPATKSAPQPERVAKVIHLAVKTKIWLRVYNLVIDKFTGIFNVSVNPGFDIILIHVKPDIRCNTHLNMLL